MIAVAAVDHNADILRVIGHLRDIDSSWRGGDELCRSLSASLLTIVDTNDISNDDLYCIASYREIKWQEYADGLSYNEIKKPKITKENIYSQFRVSRMDFILESSIPHISIEWCICQTIRDHWMDKWYIAFYIPPHNNREVPLYFLWKLYEEFAMGKHVNYFDMLGFHGTGRGMPQNRPNARHSDIDQQIPPPRV